MHKPARTMSPQALSISLISVAFAIWGAAFIYRSSFVIFNGQRSFSLFDDAMISMRYAWNFSHGYGLVWNPGEYVQGYSNFLMTLLMSLATYLFSKTMAVLAIQVSGIVFMLLVAFLTMAIAGQVIQPPPGVARSFVNVLAFACGLIYYPLAYWSLMGMETGLLAVLVLAAIWTSLEYVIRRRQRLLIASALLFGLAFLTRNESAVFVPVVWGYVWFEMQESSAGDRLRRWLVPVAAYVLIAGGLLIFQYAYYGEWLSNTYTLKLTGIPLIYRLNTGLAYVRLFLSEAFLLLALSVAGTLMAYRRDKLMLWLCILASIAYQIYVGGDAWRYWRMLAPVIPLALILGLEASVQVSAWLTDRFQRRGGALTPVGRGRMAQCLALLILLPAIWFANARFWVEATLQQRPYTVVDNRENVNKAIALNELLDQDASVGVIYGGAIPYYTGRRAVDFLGKSDRYIARVQPDIFGECGGWCIPGHNKYDLDYSIVQLRPTYVEALAFAHDDLRAWGGQYYVQVVYKGNTLYLLKDSQSVFWLKLETAP